MGGAASAVKKVGGTVASLNPFKKGDTYEAQDIADAQKLTAPTMTDFRGGGNIQGQDAYKAAQIKQVDGPLAATINQDQQAQFRAQQMGLANQLSEQAAGRGPSLAAEQFQQAQKANQAAAFAQMASQRGGPSAMGARNTQMAVQGIQAQTARDAAMGRIQEQMTARQQLGSVLEQGRGQDINLAAQQAQLTQNENLASYKGRLETAIAQGQIDQETATNMFQAANTKAIEQTRLNNAMAQQFNSLQLQYRQMGFDAQSANMRASLEVQAARRAELEKERASKAAAASAQKQVLGKAVGGVAGFMVGGPGGAMVGSQLGGNLMGGGNAAPSTAGLSTTSPFASDPLAQTTSEVATEDSSGGGAAGLIAPTSQNQRLPSEY